MLHAGGLHILAKGLLKETIGLLQCIFLMRLLTRFAKNAVIIPTYISFISNIKFWQLFYGFLFRILSEKLNNNTTPRPSKITYEENLHNNSPFFAWNYFLRTNVIAPPSLSLMNK